MLSCFRVRSIFSSRSVVSLTSSFSVKEDGMILLFPPLSCRSTSFLPLVPSLTLTVFKLLNGHQLIGLLQRHKDASQVQSEKWEKEEENEPKAHWEHKKSVVCRSCRKNRQNNARLSVYLCTVLACKRPTASLAQFMRNPPAFSWSHWKHEVVAVTLLRFRLNINAKFR